MSQRNTNKPETLQRNFLLIVISSIVIILSSFLLVATVAYATMLGWMALVIAAAALLSIFLSVMAIKTNNPAWLLLDLILPG